MRWFQQTVIDGRRVGVEWTHPDRDARRASRWSRIRGLRKGWLVRAVSTSFEGEGGLSGRAEASGSTPGGADRQAVGMVRLLLPLESGIVAAASMDVAGPTLISAMEVAVRQHPAPPAAAIAGQHRSPVGHVVPAALAASQAPTDPPCRRWTSAPPALPDPATQVTTFLLHGGASK